MAGMLHGLPCRLRRLLATGARGRLRLAFAVLVLQLAAFPAEAALTQSELQTVAAAAQPGAALPPDTLLTDAGGRTAPLAAWLDGRPALLILADTRCSQLCGPILAIAGRAIADSGLQPGRDYRLLVLGFNPTATSADGDAMRRAQLEPWPALAGATDMLTATPDAVAATEKALGYSAVYDSDAKRFAHPADVFVLTPAGRVARVLDGLSLDATAVRLALVEAGQGRIGTLTDRLHLLCYGLDPASGRYTPSVLAALRVGAGLVLAGLGGFALVRYRRRRPADGPA